MDRRMAQALDRHITGNWGEDSIQDTPCDECPVGFNDVDGLKPCPCNFDLGRCPHYGKWKCGNCQKEQSVFLAEVPSNHFVVEPFSGEAVPCCSDECVKALTAKFKTELELLKQAEDDDKANGRRF